MPDFDVYRVKRGLIVPHLTFRSLTSDPELIAGSIWFRGDLQQLRWSPADGRVLQLEPNRLVLKTWSDTTPYSIPTPEGVLLPSPVLPVIELNSPAPGHKRARETAGGGEGHIYVMALKKRAIVGSRVDVTSYIGAFVSSGAETAYLCYVLTDERNINARSLRTDVPFIRLRWTMSTLGYPNGGYGLPLHGYVIFTSPPSVSFYPTNPMVTYYNVTQIPQTPVWFVYGYEDNTYGHANQWASIQDTSMFRFTLSTPPPEVEVIRELGFMAGCEVTIARWDGEVRLHVKSGSSGLIVPLGRKVDVLDVAKGVMSFHPSKFTTVGIGWRDGERSRFALDVKVRTDRLDLGKMTPIWRLIVVDEGNGVTVLLGDTAWDGRVHSFYMNRFVVESSDGSMG